MKKLMVCLDTAYVVENWKCCSKIIFKCVNSAVEPIFNESFVEKRSLWVPWTVHGTHWLLRNAILQKKKNADARLWTQSKCILSVCLVKIKKSAYFCYYSWVPLHFLVLFIGSTVLFQLTFTFIYSTFNKKFSVSTK